MAATGWKTLLVDLDPQRPREAAQMLFEHAGGMVVYKNVEGALVPYRP